MSYFVAHFPNFSLSVDSLFIKPLVLMVTSQPFVNYQNILTQLPVSATQPTSYPYTFSVRALLHFCTCGKLVYHTYYPGQSPLNKKRHRKSCWQIPSSIAKGCTAIMVYILKAATSITSK